MAALISESRRDFLKATAAVGGGLVIGVFMPGMPRLAQAATARQPFAPSAWIRIGTDNIVTVIVDKSEMGQGVHTALPMLVAEELDADWSNVRMESAPAAPEYKHPWFGVQATGGSTSVRAMWEPLRKAGASARAMLVAAAADTWKVDAATLKTDRGTVIGPKGRKAAYGQLAAKAATLPMPKEVKLKDPKDFRIIGKSTKRLDTPGKVNGTARFGLDAKVPGMLTAVVEIWTGSQAQGPNQFTAAQIAGVKPEQVKIHTLLLGGGFGRRFAPDFLVEAVELSKAAKAPVKVIYTREDDTRAYYYRPMAVCKLAAGLDANGMPVSIHARAVCNSIAEGTGMEGMLLKERIDATSVEGLDNLPYATPSLRVEWVKYSPGVRTWFWRSVGNTQNIFFAEFFIDEMAHAAGKDPVDFRRALLVKHPRHKAVLELAAEMAGWGKPLAAGRARGVAVAESFGSYVAEVAEVSLEDGKPRVHRVVIAADVGTVVNPDTVVAQMESAVVFGLSAALYGKITLKDGKVEQSNFHDYPILRISEMPKVEVHVVKSAEPPGGVGEPGTPPIAPAVANALFALTGKRIRSLPLVA